jgi:flagella basal body P-ring formation protein FlgA
MSYQIYSKFIFGLILGLGSFGVFAQVPLEIDRAVKKAIFSQLSDPAYKVGVEYLNTKNKVPPCPGGVEVLLPQNTKIWGRVNLDLRCTNGANWTMNLPVKIVINAEYLVAARFIQGNSRVYAQDLSVAQGDIGELPEGFIQKPEQAIGRQAIRPIQMGGLITLNNLKNIAVIKAGDPVRIQVLGDGFEAGGTGTALNAAGINDLIRVKLTSGKQVQGRVISEGLVAIKLE